MEFGKYMYEVCYTEPYSGMVNTKGGQKHVESRLGDIQGNEFIVTKSGKGIWVKVSTGNYEFTFNMPISQMHNVKKIKANNKTYILFEMAKGMHWTATFGKKDKDGNRIFKPKRSCYNCSNYQPNEKASGRRKSSSGKGYSI